MNEEVGALATLMDETIHAIEKAGDAATVPVIAERLTAAGVCVAPPTLVTARDTYFFDGGVAEGKRLAAEELDVERLRAAIYAVSVRHDWANTTDTEDRTEEIAREYAARVVEPR